MTKKSKKELAKQVNRGEGVPRDYKQAVKLYTKAAEQGLPEAQDSLKAMYENGLVN